ncbi:hypothetical protein BDN70DRAFT_997297 [Pholiota conissans]|uniref:Heterokaryon incompatibility domain-containing protein n=1 Tax=Pholiota conissans TaxID=109636 RepID=A0A9P5YSS5_9AGAR|nr:hypothetical protein BDN70DRAFT_997297 [Pholiota conissans]
MPIFAMNREGQMDMPLVQAMLKPHIVESDSDDNTFLHAQSCLSKPRITILEDDTVEGVSNMKESPAHTFLDALHGFIITLIPLSNVRRNFMDAYSDKVASGPEAQNLLSALQGYISFVITQSGVENSADEIEVDLEDIDAVIHPASVNVQPKASKKYINCFVYNHDPMRDQALSQTPHKQFIQKLQVGVQKCIFREMPTRVLHFSPNPQAAGKPRITLLDRNGICTKILDAILADATVEGWFRSQVGAFSPEEDRANAEHVAIMGLVQRYSKYAILSHTWLRERSGELSFDAWNRGNHDTQQLGYQKLANFCRTAWTDHGLNFGWIDTVCINKESSSELDESIRSMYKWYQSSKVCIVYLAESDTVSDIHRDLWFTRGWTFQELIAPFHVKFYNHHWKRFNTASSNDKDVVDIGLQIQRATTSAPLSTSRMAGSPTSGARSISSTADSTSTPSAMVPCGP